MTVNDESLPVFEVGNGFLHPTNGVRVHDQRKVAAMRPVDELVPEFVSDGFFVGRVDVLKRRVRFVDDIFRRRGIEMIRTRGDDGYEGFESGHV